MKRTACLIVMILLFTVQLTGCEKNKKTMSSAELLDLGEKYLLESDYEQALVQFLAVIEIEPMNLRGYTGAADAYIGAGQNSKAITILQTGYEKTGSADIKEILDQAIAYQDDTATKQDKQAVDTQQPEKIHFPQTKEGFPKTERYDYDISDGDDRAAYAIREYNEFGNLIKSTNYTRNDIMLSATEYFYDTLQNRTQETYINHREDHSGTTRHEAYFDSDGREIKRISWWVRGWVDTVIYDYSSEYTVTITLSSTAYEEENGTLNSGYEEIITYRMQSANNTVNVHGRSWNNEGLLSYSLSEYTNKNKISDHNFNLDGTIKD